MSTCLVVFGFGGSTTSYPNYLLAKQAIDMPAGVTIFTQREVPIPGVPKAEDVVACKGYMSTLGVAKALKKYLKGKPRCENILVLAMPQHEKRCHRDMMRVFKEDLNYVLVWPSWAKEIYWPASSRWQCQKKWHWTLYNGILNLLPFALYNWLDERASKGAKK